MATVMRRLLTGHAGFYNRRYRRHGHLFQNRYKSILCQADVYLKELVRYIHLNPLRAGLFDDLKALDKYPFCGHSAVMGRKSRTWQDTDGVADIQTREGTRPGSGKESILLLVGKRTGNPHGGSFKIA